MSPGAFFNLLRNLDEGLLSRAFTACLLNGFLEHRKQICGRARNSSSEVLLESVVCVGYSSLSSARIFEDSEPFLLDGYFRPISPHLSTVGRFAASSAHPEKACSERETEKCLPCPGHSFWVRLLSSLFFSAPHALFLSTSATSFRKE
ncbi:MAG: uncharacterized protein A8A55_2396 [Amphiamblys sp. WSBS2006]|nr:MAG: uncharacterized protein A8A55_2396 [Amphiamblys sp. WSBS2006]